MAGFLLALQFLTALPAHPPDTTIDAEQRVRMELALPWFPFVGGLLGGLLALADWALTSLLALDVRDVLILVLMALLTGMLHLDGFIDCCDGLLGIRNVARRLEIMRDSRVGAYGAIGAALLCLTQYAALGALPPSLRALVLVAAPLLGRWSMVYAVVCYPYARATGAGAAFHARRRHLALATSAAVVLLVAASGLGGRYLLQQGLVMLTLALIAVLVTLLWTRWASRRLAGGLTGDTYGALNELVVVAIFILAPVVLRGVSAFL